MTESTGYNNDIYENEDFLVEGEEFVDGKKESSIKPVEEESTAKELEWQKGKLYRPNREYDNLSEMYESKPSEEMIEALQFKKMERMVGEVRKNRINNRIFILKKDEYITGDGKDKHYRGNLTENILAIESPDKKNIHILGTLSNKDEIVKITYENRKFGGRDTAFLKNGTILEKSKGIDYSSRDVAKARDINSFRNLLANR